jgi:hypothetical protein
MDRPDDGRPQDVVSEADAERWTLCVEIARHLMQMPAGVVSITRVSDQSATLAAARVLFRSDIPT